FFIDDRRAVGQSVILPTGGDRFVSIEEGVAMAVATGLVCCLLLAQPMPETKPAPPAREEAAGPLVPVETHRKRPTPEEMLAEGLMPPEQSPLAGRAVSLL